MTYWFYAACLLSFIAGINLSDAPILGGILLYAAGICIGLHTYIKVYGR